MRPPKGPPGVPAPRSRFQFPQLEGSREPPASFSCGSVAPLHACGFVPSRWACLSYPPGASELPEAPTVRYLCTFAPEGPSKATCLLGYWMAVVDRKSQWVEQTPPRWAGGESFARVVFSPQS